MRYKLIMMAGLFLILIPQGAGGQWNFAPPPPKEEYGNVLINRTSVKNGVKPATFSHWMHRRRHTCRVCHSELEFNMKLNTTEITEEANKSGKYCGACHNGYIAFGHEKANCEKCHNGNIGFGKEKFPETANLPGSKFGDGINWVAAMREGSIKPLRYLKTKSDDIPFQKDLVLEAEWNYVANAVFSHKSHTEWLDCNNCHPDIFNIKKKATKHFSMEFILNGQFCGVCHLNVAFPIQDCKRCHPTMKEGWY